MNRNSTLTKEKTEINTTTITLAEITQAMSNISAFKQDYQHIRGRIFENIENTLKSNLEQDLTVLNDIHDVICMAEEESYISGFVEGVEFMKRIGNL